MYNGELQVLIARVHSHGLKVWTSVVSHIDDVRERLVYSDANPTRPGAYPIAIRFEIGH